MATVVPAQEPRPIADAVLMTPQLPEGVTGTLRTINATLSKGLAPRDNVVVALMPLFGVEAFELPLRRDSLAMLGIDKLPAGGPEFKYLGPYVAVTTQTDEQQSRLADAIGLQLSMAQDRLWTAEEYPELQEYLTANEAALATVVAATRRPRYYAPMLSLEEPPRLLSADLGIERRLSYLVHCLAARALSRLAAGDVAAARQDVLTGHRLAEKLASGSPFDVSVAKADIIDAISFRATLVVIQSGKLTGAAARTWLTELQSLPRMPGPDRAAAVGERAIIHQELEFLRTDAESAEGFFEDSEPGVKEMAEKLKLSDLNWEPALKRADELQDQIVRALAIPQHEAQFARFAELDREQADWEAHEDEKFRDLQKLVESDPAAVSRLLGETMQRSLRCNYWQRRHSADRSALRRDFLTVGLALCVYRGERGEYPAKLADLAPAILKSVPLDPHTDAPFHYDRSAPDRAVLASWGANRMNDAGQEYNDDHWLSLP